MEAVLVFPCKNALSQRFLSPYTTHVLSMHRKVCGSKKGRRGVKVIAIICGMIKKSSCCMPVP